MTYFILNSKSLLTVTIGAVPYALSPRHQTRSMSSETYRLLVHLICLRFPTTPVHCRSDHIVTPNSLLLDHTVIFFDYVVVEGKRFYASRMVGWNWSSLIRILIPGPLPIDAYGEVLEILQIGQDFRNVGYPLWLARMRWFKWWSQE